MLTPFCFYKLGAPTYFLPLDPLSIRPGKFQHRIRDPGSMDSISIPFTDARPVGVKQIVTPTLKKLMFPTYFVASQIRFPNPL